MLIEKYMNVEIDVGGDEYDFGDTEYEEVEVSNSEIRHYIDTYLSAEDVLDYAKQIAPEEFKDENSADLDLAYDILIEEFDEHDDIHDIADLNEYIQECVNHDFKNEAYEQYYDRLEDKRTEDELMHWNLI